MGTNSIELTGKIIKGVERDREHIVLTIHSFNGKNHDIFPHCLVKKSLLPSEIDVSSRMRVRVKGHYERSIRNLNGKKVPSQQIIVDSIVADSTMTEKAFGIKGKFYDEGTVRVLLSGKVVKFNIERGSNGRSWARIVINTGESDTEKNSLSLSLPVPDRMPEIKVGDTFCCVCNVDTPEKIIDGKKVRYEDILVTDFAVDSAS